MELLQFGEKRSVGILVVSIKFIGNQPLTPIQGKESKSSIVYKEAINAMSRH